MSADIDIDFADRTKILNLIKHTPARQLVDGQVRRHNTGVYVTDIPRDPINQCAAIDYQTADNLGYFKIDFLNMSVYQSIRDQAHYQKLLDTTPDWQKFNNDMEFFQKLVHVANHWGTLQTMPEPVDSIPRLAMFLAIIRPGKRHLAGKTWAELAKTVWDQTEEGYSFKKAHAVSYAVLVSVHMNIISESYEPK
jgi:hypothetical protein